VAIRPGLATPGPSSLVMTMKEPRWKTRSAGPSALPALPDTVTIGKTYSCAYHFVNNMETVIRSDFQTEGRVTFSQVRCVAVAR